MCFPLIELVKEVVKSKLLPAWLRLQDGKVLDLLHRLDVENCAETAFEVLHALFSRAESLEELLQDGISLDSRYERVEGCVVVFSLKHYFGKRAHLFEFNSFLFFFSSVYKTQHS